MKSRLKGFTLIEIMIVVAIVAILASIAYPSYLEHVRNERRTEARAALVDLASFMERYYTEKMIYTGVTLPYDKVPREAGSGTTYYNLAAEVTDSTYKIEATPVGVQDGDRCGVLSIDNRGSKTAGADSCW